MKWPWSVEDELRQAHNEIDRLVREGMTRDQQLRDLKDAIDSRQRTDAALILDLKLEVDQKDDEIRRLERELAELKKSPEGPFLTCPCGSHRTAVVHHIVGWKRGPEGAVPVPLGGQVVCVDCRSPLNIDEGVERAKVKERHGDKERERPPVQDSDLRFSGRRR